MIKHIVLFKLKNMESQHAKLEVMNNFKEAIESLPCKIDVIRNIEVGLNVNPTESYDIALNSDFDTMEDLATYATHPAHMAAGKILAAFKESRACVDYVY